MLVEFIFSVKLFLDGITWNVKRVKNRCAKEFYYYSNKSQDVQESLLVISLLPLNFEFLLGDVLLNRHKFCCSIFGARLYYGNIFANIGVFISNAMQLYIAVSRYITQ